MKKIYTIIIAILCSLILFTGCSSRSKIQYEGEVNIYNWSEYLPKAVIDKFEQEYKIKVNYAEYSSNEEMLAKIMAGGSRYDIAVATDYMVDVMIKQNLLHEINHQNVPNFKNLGEDFVNHEYDRGNKFSVAYMAGSAIIAVNKNRVNTEIKSYDDLWDDAFKNSLVVLDDQRAILGIALKKLGYSFNETNTARLEEAKQELFKLKPNIKAFDSDSPKSMLINGEATVGFVWNAEASLARKENPNIEVIYPTEGVYLWQDNFVLPKGGRNKEAAEKFINFILRPEISILISEEFPYTNPNVEAWKLMDKDILEDKAIYPTKDLIEKGEYLKDVGDLTPLYDEIWTEFKQR
jgi:spermidine/putrescine transport system permease protein